MESEKMILKRLGFNKEYSHLIKDHPEIKNLRSQRKLIFMGRDSRSSNAFQGRRIQNLRLC